MARRTSPDPVTKVADRIGHTVGQGSAPQDLPAEAWARLLAVALSRLRRARPRWASRTASQVDALIAAWRVFSRDRSLSPAERDLRLEEGLEQIENDPPWARGRPAGSSEPERVPAAKARGRRRRTRPRR